jgi:S1-C subfamily serine protease
VLSTDGDTYYATVVSKDPSNDLAVIQLFEDEDRNNKVSGLQTVTLGDSDNLEIGSKVIAIGNALTEFNNTTTSGIISGKGREITASGSRDGATNLSNLLQTDAAINPGNSGGPLVNLAGQVIGINTAIAQQANGIGFAIPINDVKAVLESVEKYGKIVRPYLGVRYTELTPAIAKEFDLGVENGAYLIDDIQNRQRAVLEDSPAAKAGLRSGDIITEVNGTKIDEKNTLIRLIGQYQVGDSVKLTIVRNNQTISLNVKLEEFQQPGE